MSRLTNDIDNVSNSLSQSITQLMSGSIVIIGSHSHDVHPQSSAYIGKPDYDTFGQSTCPHHYKENELVVQDQQRQLGKLNGHIEETISGILVVKAFNHEEKAITRV